MQAHAEHQQHHADFGELLRESDVGDETRRRRADDDAGDEITESAGSLSRTAMKPNTRARPNAAAIVAIRVTSCGMRALRYGVEADRLKRALKTSTTMGSTEIPITATTARPKFSLMIGWLPKK